MAKRRDTTTAIETTDPDDLARLARALEQLPPGITANPDGTVTDARVVEVFDLAEQVFDDQFLIAEAHVYRTADGSWLGDLDRAIAHLRERIP